MAQAVAAAEASVRVAMAVEGPVAAAADAALAVKIDSAVAAAAAAAVGAAPTPGEVRAAAAARLPKWIPARHCQYGCSCTTPPPPLALSPSCTTASPLPPPPLRSLSPPPLVGLMRARERGQVALAAAQAAALEDLKRQQACRYAFAYVGTCACRMRRRR